MTDSLIDDPAKVSRRASLAVQYLSETDVDHANAKANLNALQELKKTIYGYAFIDAQGSVEARKAAAYTSSEYIEHIEKIKQAEIDYQVMTNKRTNAALSVELYRTMSANNRKGQI